MKNKEPTVELVSQSDYFKSLEQGPNKWGGGKGENKFLTPR